MPSPRDWFRRRRRDTDALLPPERPDPFADVPVLELRRADPLDARPEPALRIANDERRSMVPPPPSRSSGREARVIQPEAFSVRPEVRGAAGDVAVAERPDTVADTEQKVAGAGFTVRRRAVFIQRRPAGGTVTPLPSTGRAPLFGPEKAGAADAKPVVLRAVEPAGKADDAPPRLDLRPAELAPAKPAIKVEPVPPPPPRAAAKPALSVPAPERARETTRPAWSARGEADEAMPGFTLAAPGVGFVKSKTNLQDLGAVNAILREAFTPTRPKQQAGLFSGRFKQMQRIIAGIEEERAHVVLYGERGSGKTSLANIVAAKAEEAGYHVVKLACSSDLHFDELFHQFLRRVPSAFLSEGLGVMGRQGLENFEQLLPQGEIGVADLVRILQRVHDRHVILVLDEYDRITNAATKAKLAELLKNMSDASAPVTLILIGVAENVDELLGQHPSLRRTLVTIPLPLMSRKEIEGIIATGEKKSGLTFAPEIREKVMEFAQGLPYHAQLLCLFSARSAVRRHSNRVERDDLAYAVERATEEAETQVKEAYTQALSGDDPAALKDVLFAAARSRSDEFGTFALKDVAVAEGAPPLAESFAKLCEPAHGAVLRRIATPEGPRWQFFSQMMRHYVIVRQAAERGLV